MHRATALFPAYRGKYSCQDMIKGTTNVARRNLCGEILIIDNWHACHVWTGAGRCAPRAPVSIPWRRPQCEPNARRRDRVSGSRQRMVACI